MAWCQQVRRASTRLFPHTVAARPVHAAMSLFDWQVGRTLPRLGCRAVVAYETSAQATFVAAKSLGMYCILDAANLHHSVQSQWVPEANTAAIAKLKAREIELADLILTCSTLARDSYISAGVPAEKVYSVPLGVDLKLFDPSRLPLNVDQHTEPIVFCNAGILDRRKGIDLIASACRSVRARGYSFEFRIIGNAAVAEPELIRSLRAVATIGGRLPQVALPEFYRSADVFVLPSRFDSFGMVVTEALACGLPVIVTENVGAKDLVEEGVNGWVIPANDADSLADRMAWCAANPQAVRAMAVAARASAEGCNWTRYHRVALKVLAPLLAPTKT